MSVDPQFGNSSGYFRDPISGEDLTVDQERVVPCSFENGKFTWPCVLRSDGEQVLKIVYKLFTEEEKTLYKMYRGRDTNTSERKPRQKSEGSLSGKPKQTGSVIIKEEPNDFSDAELVRFDDEYEPSVKVLETLAMCNQFIGVSWIAGIAYALVSRKGSNVIYHIPRSCIPDEEVERLCNGLD